jgi:hypothetical protein
VRKYSSAARGIREIRSSLFLIERFWINFIAAWVYET